MNTDKILFKSISRISPSQFQSLKNCAYKSILAEAFGKHPLLPISPNAYLGSVLHKMLELISKREIKSDTEFYSRLDTEISLKETELKENGFDFFVPLQMNVREYGTKIIQLRKHLRSVNELSPRIRSVKYITEKWFESKDKLIGGKIDLIIESDEGIEIIDFKTGAITEDILDDSGEAYLEIKTEYQLQLKLYAYLYFENTGKFPEVLSLVDLSKQKFSVQFTENECKLVYEEAKNLLLKTNLSIETNIFNANPNESNCMFCLYRPACTSYLKYQVNANSFNDVCGLLIGFFQYSNGNVSAFIEKGTAKITVTGFGKDKLEYFNRSKNKQVQLFNLKKEGNEFVYSATKTTIIYE